MRGKREETASHRTERGEVIDFVVQLEVRIGDEWRVVLQYDCAHDVHAETATISMGEQRKEELRLPYAEALILADEDINTEWQTYIEQFPREEFP